MRLRQPMPTGAISMAWKDLNSSPLLMGRVPQEEITQSKYYCHALAGQMPLALSLDVPKLDSFVRVRPSVPYLQADYYKNLRVHLLSDNTPEINFVPKTGEIFVRYLATEHSLSDIIPSWIELPIGEELIRWNLWEKRIFVTTPNGNYSDDGPFPNAQQLQVLKNTLTQCQKYRVNQNSCDAATLALEDPLSLNQLSALQIEVLHDLALEFDEQLKIMTLGLINVDALIDANTGQAEPNAIRIQLMNLRVEAWIKDGQLTLKVTRWQKGSLGGKSSINISQSFISRDEASKILDLLDTYNFEGMNILPDNIVPVFETYLMDQVPTVADEDV